MMCFGGFIFRDVFRWLWCTVYMRHHLYLVSFIPCVLRGWRLIIFADSKKKNINHLIIPFVLKLLFKKIDQVQTITEPWSRQWLGECTFQIVLRSNFLNHNLLGLIMSLIKCKENVNVIFPLVIHLMVRQMNDILTIIISSHIYLSNPYLPNYKFQQYYFLNPFNKGNVLLLNVDNSTIYCWFIFQLIFITNNLNTKHTSIF